MAAPRILYAEEHVAFVRDRAGKLPDHIIGEGLGFSARKVRLIRIAHGIASGYKKHRPHALVDAVRREYVEAGRSANEVGADLGVAGATVRKIARDNKMGRPRRFAVANATAAVRRRVARPVQPKPPAKPFVPTTRLVSANDAALIAEFMASKPVTVLEPGHAAGITLWETMLGRTSPPPQSGPRAVQARGNADKAKRLAGQARAG